MHVWQSIGHHSRAAGPRKEIPPSEGFRVDGPGGRIGIVEEVRDVRDEPLLAVRAGLLGRRVLLIPATEVFEIVPRAMRIWLRTRSRSRAASRSARPSSIPANHGDSRASDCRPPRAA
jgi:hypothetical protein